jgi:two-component system chemotaxis sensor kinase CheA
MIRLDPKGWAPFWAAFIHVIRNAVDHGLESADGRQQAGKVGTGRLQLRTRVDGSDFVIDVRDDGAGIPWQRVRERAGELGLPHETHQQLVDALFVEGLSTASEISEMSGRGVELSVVSAACLERGGKMGVSSLPGQGTTFAFRFPQAAISVKPETMLREPESGPQARLAAPPATPSAAARRSVVG